MQNRFPLNKARRWGRDLSFFLKINLLPRAPVSIGIINIAAAGKELHVAFATELCASPFRKAVGIENIAFVAAFCIGRTAQQKYLSQITGRGIEPALCLCKGG